jgi:hypothetical protein
MTTKPTIYSQHVVIVNGILSLDLTKDISRQQLDMTMKPLPSNEQHAEIEFGYQ